MLKCVYNKIILSVYNIYTLTDQYDCENKNVVTCSYNLTISK